MVGGNKSLFLGLRAGATNTLNQKSLMGYQEVSPRRSGGRIGAADRAALTDCPGGRRRINRPCRQHTGGRNRSVVAHRFQRKIRVEGSNDHFAGTAVVVRRLRLLAIFGGQAAGHPVMIMLTEPRCVGVTLMLTTREGQGSLPNAGTVYPLQGQTNTHYQEVERQPGGKPPCKFTDVHGAKLGARSGADKPPYINVVLMV